MRFFQAPHGTVDADLDDGRHACVRTRYAPAMNVVTPSLQHLQVHREGLATLCCRHSVRRLAVFGSTVRGEPKAGSDYDFLVEFDAMPTGGYATAFFGLQEDLQALLGAPVDLVVESAIRNPYFRQSVQAQRHALYAA